jgi:hypothetical protein
VLEVRRRQEARDAEIAAGLGDFNPFSHVGMTVEEFKQLAPAALWAGFVHDATEWGRDYARVLPLLKRHPHLLTPPGRMPQRPACELQRCMLLDKEVAALSAAPSTTATELDMLQTVQRLGTFAWSSGRSSLYAVAIDPNLWATFTFGSEGTTATSSREVLEAMAARLAGDPCKPSREAETQVRHSARFLAVTGVAGAGIGTWRAARSYAVTHSWVGGSCRIWRQHECECDWEL